MKKHLLTFVLILLIIVGGYAGFRLVNYSLIQMALVTDLKSSDFVQHSLFDNQAKKEILQLYTQTNDQLSALAKSSKTYLSYTRGKQLLIQQQEDQMNVILRSYRQRKQARWKAAQED